MWSYLPLSSRKTWVEAVGLFQPRLSQLGKFLCSWWFEKGPERLPDHQSRTQPPSRMSPHLAAFTTDLLPLAGKRRREWGLACRQCSFAGPRHEGGMAFHLLHSHHLQLRAALEQLYLLAYPNSVIAVVDIRDSFRHFILLSVLYCFHEHITWTSQSQYAFKNQSYSEREKPQTKTSKPRRILIC